MWTPSRVPHPFFPCASFDRAGAALSVLRPAGQPGPHGIGLAALGITLATGRMWRCVRPASWPVATAMSRRSRLLGAVPPALLVAWLGGGGAALLAASLSATFAQTTPRYRVDVDLVRLTVTARDSHGAIVHNLAPEEFQVFEAGVREAWLRRRRRLWLITRKRPDLPHAEVRHRAREAGASR